MASSPDISPTRLSPLPTNEQQLNNDNDLKAQQAENKDRGVEEDINVRKLIKDRFGTPVVPVLDSKREKVNEQTLYQRRGYRDTNKLGEGAYGAVFKAIQTKDGVEKEMAVKKCCLLKVKGDRVLNKKEYERVRRRHLEEQIAELTVYLQSVDHAHIPKLFDYFVIDDTFYLCMEMAQNSLYEYIKKQGCISDSRLSSWGKQLAEAVAFMHSKGFTHNDIKLANILIFKESPDARSVLKLVDFGLSRVSYIPGYGILKSSSYCGTRNFMAPEILETDVPNSKMWYDPFACDVFALGATLYVMAFKKYPRKDGDVKFEINFSRKMAYDFDVTRNTRKVEPVLKPLDPLARHLIRNMLEYDTRKRITMKGVLTHKFWDKPTSKK